MATQKLTAYEIQNLIVGSFQDASDYLNFMQAISMNNVNGAEWARTNQVEIENDREFQEAISRIELAVKQEAQWLMEVLIKKTNREQFGLLGDANVTSEIEDHFEDNNFAWLKQADRDQITAITDLNYEEARELIERDGTLF